MRGLMSFGRGLGRWRRRTGRMNPIREQRRERLSYFLSRLAGESLTIRTQGTWQRQQIDPRSQLDSGRDSAGEESLDAALARIEALEQTLNELIGEDADTDEEDSAVRVILHRIDELEEALVRVLEGRAGS